MYITNTSAPDKPLGIALHRILEVNDAAREGYGVADAEIDYHEALPDPKADQPIDAARRRLDIPVLLDREGVSDKARATLRFLAETHGSGKQCDLAAQLMASPARITHLKRELADALATDGYHGPLGRRPST